MGDVIHIATWRSRHPPSARPRPARDPEGDMYWFADLLNLGTAPSAVPDAPETEAETAEPTRPPDPAEPA